MNVDLIDMGNFLADEPDQNEEGAQSMLSSQRLSTRSTEYSEFFPDEVIGLREHSEASVLIPVTNPTHPTNPYQKEEKPIFNLVRSNETVQSDFLKTSKLWRCLECLNLDEYNKYFDVTTQEVVDRLKYTLYGHYLGMKPVAFTNQTSYQNVNAQTQN